MNRPRSGGPPGMMRRRMVELAANDLVVMGPIVSGGKLPLLVRPGRPNVDLASWLVSNRSQVDELLGRHGGILFRDFGINSAAAFQEVAQRCCFEMLEYKERSTPRRKVGDRVYTSTEYPSNQQIFLHNENSYQLTFPRRILFYCLTPAHRGGETPLADCRGVLKRIRPPVADRFAKLGVMYVRNFGDGLGLTWQDAFQTHRHEDVEAYCASSQIAYEWKAANRLRIRSVLPAIEIHPDTGESVWFNHAAFFHASSLDGSIRNALLRDYREDELPNHTYYGDGSAIGSDTVEELRQAYREEKIAFPWQRGDLLMLDNMLAAHAREPFQGPREILTVMADPLKRAARTANR